MYNRHETRDCEIARLRDCEIVGRGSGQWIVSSKEGERDSSLSFSRNFAILRSCYLTLTLTLTTDH